MYSGTAGDNLTWDASEEVLIITGTNGATSLNVADGNVTIADDLAVDGTSNLDNTDIEGTLVVDGTNISLDSTTTLNIDNSNTSNGITIGTATSGVPISIGHTTSETTINDNLTVTGTVDIGGGAIDGTAIGATSASTIVGTTIDASTDFTIGDTIITDGVVTDSTGLQLAANLDINGTADISGDLTLSGGADGALQFTNAGENSIKIPDNQASALIIEEADNAYITFVTSNGSEAITVAKATTFSAGIANAGTIGAGTWQGTAIASSYIAADAITSAKIADDAVGADELAANAVVDASVASGAAIAVSKLALTAGDGLTLNTNDIDLDATLTTVTSITNASLKLGRDSDNLVDFATTDNKIIFRVEGVNEVELVQNALSPVTSDGVALGTSSLMWSDLFLASGGVVNFNNGDVTLTHASDTLTLAGGQLLVPDGTAALPSVSNDGDPNTGMNFPAADSVAWSAGGTERMRMDQYGLIVTGGEYTTSQVPMDDARNDYSTNGYQDDVGNGLMGKEMHLTIPTGANTGGIAIDTQTSTKASRGQLAFRRGYSTGSALGNTGSDTEFGAISWQQVHVPISGQTGEGYNQLAEIAKIELKGNHSVASTARATLDFYTSSRGGDTSSQTGSAYYAGVSGPELAMRINYNQQVEVYNSFSIKRNANNSARLQIYDTDGSHYNSFASPAMTAHVNYILPATDGSNTQQLQTDGSANLTWVSASSSLRYKEDIKPLEIDSSKIYELTPKSFKFIEGHKTSLPGEFGYIAEEVEKILPELVLYDKENRPDALMYELLTVLLLEEVKKLRSMITEE